MQLPGPALPPARSARPCVYFGEDGAFSRSWPIGTTALWMALLLSGYVLIHYLS